jgi:hypothetical protein
VTQMKTAAGGAAVSALIFFMIALSGLSPDRAYAHEPGAFRDCSAYPYAPPFPPVPTGYKPRYHTTARDFLDFEQGVGPVTDSEYAILDAVIDEAKIRLKPIPAGLDDVPYKQFAIDSLKTIDCILVSHGFVYPGIGLVQLLSDGLDPTTFSDARYYQALLLSAHNAGRTIFIEQRKPGPYYVVDCDIAAYMYLAIAEIMKYPLAMVQMPLHNFIRWRLPGGGYIDFETMDGKQTDDNYYEVLWGIPSKFLGTPGVLTTMSDAQLLAYEYFGVAISYTWKHDIPTAIAKYEKAMSVDATLGDSANNLAWLYAVVPDVRFRDGQKAVAYAQKAVSISQNGDWLDTLACAYGAAGNFAEGVAAEKRAKQAGWAPSGSNIQGDLDLLSGGHPCEDPTFGIDPHPFRPSQPTPARVHNKDANAIH